ncbi:hypothetical protein ACFTRE_09630 [Bacillus subtilis]|uniref:hypothetical protein n=1 Tax=Bacillus subtilis TaxID=1423 RepID=UPI0003642D17|nr:hypothetical protein [Bacillus subtilis]OEI75430.1 hypothetical protein BG616_15010 [Bacillus subtilis]
MSNITMKQTPLTMRSMRNKGRIAIAVALASISVSGSGHATAGNETPDSNSAHIKRYSFAYDNTKSNLTEASPKKEEQFVVDKKQFVFKQKNVTNSGDLYNKQEVSFQKPLRFTDKEMFREVEVSNFTEVEHSVYKELNTDSKQISFRKPIKFHNNSDFHEVTNYQPIEYAQEKDDWI